MINSNLTSTEIDWLIKLMREDYLATKINVESELITNLNLESLAEDYKKIKDKLESLRPKEDTNVKVHNDPEKLLNGHVEGIGY